MITVLHFLKFCFLKIMIHIFFNEGINLKTCFSYFYFFIPGVLFHGIARKHILSSINALTSFQIDISLAKPPSENKKKEQRKREQERRMMRAYMYGDVDYFYSAPMSRGGRMGAAAGPRRTYAG